MLAQLGDHLPQVGQHPALDLDRALAFHWAMKQNIALTTLVSCALNGFIAVAAESQGSFSVLAAGAKGDGASDDTAAIQQSPR